MEREKMEAWADALLDQHRTTPKVDRDPVAQLSPLTRMAVEAGAVKLPDLGTYTAAAPQTTYDPDAWVGKAKAMAMILVGVLVLGLVLALVAG